MAGRPSKYTPETIEKITSAIALGAPFVQACNYAGISEDTFARWRSQNTDFADAIKNAEGRSVVGWLDKIEKAAKDGNWQAAAWKLERRFPSDFGRRDRLEMEVKPKELTLETAREEYIKKYLEVCPGQVEAAKLAAESAFSFTQVEDHSEKQAS